MKAYNLQDIKRNYNIVGNCDALNRALNIALQVEYVDEMDTALNHHVFPEAATPSVYLLYKTSHYNILYAADKH